MRSSSLLRRAQYVAKELWSRIRQGHRLADFGPTELFELAPYALGSHDVLHKLYTLSRDTVNRKVPGDFVECGVCNGGSAAAIALGLKSTDKRAWLYDSFKGLPPATFVDGPDAQKFYGACVGSEENVAAAMRLVDFPLDRCLIRKGWFTNTLREDPPEQISFLHIDADWYDSVLLVLDTFYDRVAPGGIIVLDDFGHWEGCREAFYDFTVRMHLKPLLERFGHTQAFWIKDRLHNREFIGQWEIP
jgi:O-methyltransferase